MEDVVKDPQGTANGSINLGEMPVAGKTGTTDESKDIWFEGYTPYYTCGIWGGYDNNDALPDYDRSFSAYAKTLWNSIMTRVHAELPVTQFAQPSNIVSATVCKKSGKLAIEGLCTADPRGSQAYTEYFLAGTEPTAVCDAHAAAAVCTVTGLKASPTCPATTKVCVQRPQGSEGVTDDSNYALPTQTCPGHQNAVQVETESESETNPDGTVNIGGNGNTPQNPGGTSPAPDPNTGETPQSDGTIPTPNGDTAPTPGDGTAPPQNDTSGDGTIIIY